jgi:hypothetical protein
MDDGARHVGVRLTRERVLPHGRAGTRITNGGTVGKEEFHAL